jgi:hypothetical protein
VRGHVESKTFAAKLDWLFDLRLDDNGRQRSFGNVARASGGRITASYVFKLRAGSMTNPGLQAVRVLAEIFSVPLDYFVDGGEYLEPMIEALGPTLNRESALHVLGDALESLDDLDVLRALIILQSL